MQCAHQRADAIPHDLDANANQKKRGQTQDDAHAGFAHHGRQAVGETITNINAGGVGDLRRA